MTEGRCAAYFWTKSASIQLNRGILISCLIFEDKSSLWNMFCLKHACWWKRRRTNTHEKHAGIHWRCGLSALHVSRVDRVSLPVCFHTGSCWWRQRQSNRCPCGSCKANHQTHTHTHTLRPGQTSSLATSVLSSNVLIMIWFVYNYKHSKMLKSKSFMEFKPMGIQACFWKRLPAPTPTIHPFTCTRSYKHTPHFKRSPFCFCFFPAVCTASLRTFKAFCPEMQGQRKFFVYVVMSCPLGLSVSEARRTLSSPFFT